jgi:hypothetical protein
MNAGAGSIETAGIEPAQRFQPSSVETDSAAMRRPEANLVTETVAPADSADASCPTGRDPLGASRVRPAGTRAVFSGNGGLNDIFDAASVATRRRARSPVSALTCLTVTLAMSGGRDEPLDIVLAVRLGSAVCLAMALSLVAVPPPPAKAETIRVTAFQQNLPAYEASGNVTSSPPSLDCGASHTIELHERLVGGRRCTGTWKPELPYLL